MKWLVPTWNWEVYCFVIFLFVFVGFFLHSNDKWNKKKNQNLNHTANTNHPFIQSFIYASISKILRLVFRHQLHSSPSSSSSSSLHCWSMLQRILLTDRLYTVFQPWCTFILTGVRSTVVAEALVTKTPPGFVLIRQQNSLPSTKSVDHITNVQITFKKPTTVQHWASEVWSCFQTWKSFFIWGKTLTEHFIPGQSPSLFFIPGVNCQLRRRDEHHWGNIQLIDGLWSWSTAATVTAKFNLKTAAQSWVSDKVSGIFCSKYYGRCYTTWTTKWL